MGDTAPPAKPGWAAHFKAWAEAASAAFKAGLNFLFLCLVLGAATMLLWREATTHALHVAVGKEVQSALTLHGGDIDLGLALQDALNDRLQGVRRIIEVQGLKVVGGDDESESVSFKPFGVDVTTDEVTRLTDLMLNRPKPPTVRLELLCDGGPCTEAAARPASLTVTYLGPAGQRRAAYPLARGTAALRRTIRQAIQNIADVVLEQSEPGIASIWFLNRGSVNAIALDQYTDDLSRAVGAAVLARASEKPSDCVSDLVIGVSLLRRNAFSEGVAAERRAPASSGRACQIHLLTNIVIGLLGPAYCFDNPDIRDSAKREIDKALASLEDLQGSPGPDIVMLRIPGVKSYVRLLDVLRNAGGDAVQNWCNLTPASPHGPPGDIAGQIAQIMRETRQSLPAHPSGEPMHNIVSGFWFAIRAGIHTDDLDDRLMLDLQLLEMARAYHPTDLAPRQLDMIEGQLETDIASAVLDAFQLDPDKQAALAVRLGAAPNDTPDRKTQILVTALIENRNDAVVSFQDAHAVHAVPLTDPPDLDMLGLLGDADMLMGQPLPAQAAYASAADAFADANEPVEQFPNLADLLARWAGLRIATGACIPDAPPDSAWQSKWARFGYTAPDICAWQHESKPATITPPAPSNLPSLFSQVRAEMLRCPSPGGLLGYKTLSPAKQAMANIDFLTCHDGLQAKMRFLALGRSAHALDAELTQALLSAQ